LSPLPCLSVAAFPWPGLAFRPGGVPVGLFQLVTWALAVLVAVTLYWPFTIPLFALAYKVRHGTDPLPHEPGPFWLRSTFAALGLALMSLLLLISNAYLVESFPESAGPIHLILLMILVPAGALYLFWMYAFEDFFQALSLLIVYLMMTGIPLLLIDRFVRFWHPVAGALTWLQPSPP